MCGPDLASKVDEDHLFLQAWVMLIATFTELITLVKTLMKRTSRAASEGGKHDGISVCKDKG